MLKLYKAQFFYPFHFELGTFREHLQKHDPKSDGWFDFSQDRITGSSPVTYGEYQYFHPHARSVLFMDRDEKQKALLVYEVRPEKIQNHLIQVDLVDKDGNTYTRKVHLDWVMLYAYDLDVGILSFGVSLDLRKDEDLNLNSEEFSLDDALDLNNVLRRSAPSFLDYGELGKFSENASHCPENGWAGMQKASFCRELPLAIRLLDNQGEPVAEASEDFGNDFDGFLSDKKEFYRGKHFGFWLDRFYEDLQLGSYRDSKGKQPYSSAGTSFAPILDERNFVCSFLIADPEDTLYCDNRDTGLKQCDVRETDFEANVFGDLGPESDEFRTRLYQTMFVDPSTTEYVANPPLRDRLLARALYLRHRNLGTYFGFTRYSGVYLTHGDPPDFLARHFDSMYFQMANRLLCLRAALLNFSERAGKLAHKARDTDSLEEPGANEKLKNLRCDFLRFHNGYWFCEITGQEQGIEIFDLWNRNMGNRRLFEEVGQEVEALHEFSLSTLGQRLGTLTYLNLTMVLLTLVILMTAGSVACGIGLGLIGALVIFASLMGGKCLLQKVQKIVDGGWKALRSWGGCCPGGKNESNRR